MKYSLSLRDLPRAQAIFCRISRLESRYRHSQLQRQYRLPWGMNTGIVDSPYCSVYWAIRENIAQLIEKYWRDKFQYYNF